MKIGARVALAACGLAALLGDAGAQKVYRCGPDGRIYQQTACADGKPVDAADARTPEQRQAAQAVAKNEAKAAAQLDPAPPPPTKGSAKAKPDAPAPAAKPASTAKDAKAEAKAPVYLLPKPAASAAK